MNQSMHDPSEPRTPEPDPLQPARRYDPVIDPNVNGDAERDKRRDDDRERPMDPDLPAPNEPTPLSDDRR
ncbi:hypothetical protein IF690_15810 [Pseudomonas sp. SK3(2021)]|uniref:hypothetical protein n=1 Tax=Pseudomonas sp. SK3(2021) TaxID=2841064 RepID=UPI00192C3649|nr:hypothetical protein [Pseudomonas sp. SK3(2021)]QQZ39525.1 hypothetical protein IF690_15810 [Pseudomonas sp. SK3(2021)]